MKNYTLLSFLTLGLATIASTQLVAQPTTGEVYTLSNQSTGNSVVVFRRGPGGVLTLAASFPTGGTGLGTGNDPLGSQGAVVLDQSARFLFAVNAGSNDVSVFAIQGDNLELLNKVSSGGVTPVSIAVRGNLVYVVNAGGVPNVSGFTIDHRTNSLLPLPGSTRGLVGGASANPAEVSFSADGETVIVTEKGTQAIDTFNVNEDGYLSGPISNPSSGASPFGFQFANRGIVVVSEAGPNALSSYKTSEDGRLELITGTLANGQAATCWAVVTNDGRFAFSINSATATISSYKIAENGSLTLLNPVAATTGAGSAPTDAALTRDSKLLYVRVGALGQIQGFRVEEDGRLTPIGSVGGVPSGSQGLAIR
jgi:6-phosphogluconolactonase (cycloisomerase 2 family)